MKRTKTKQSVSNRNLYDQMPTFMMLVDGLDTDDQAQLEQARLGPAVVPFLLREALDTKRSISHRVRLLDVIEHMDHPLPPESWLELMMTLGKIKSPELRFKIADVMACTRSRLA